jgi:hypothetical protein
VDCGVAFATVALACDALALDWAALGLVTLGLVALVLINSFAGEVDAFWVVRAGLAPWAWATRAACSMSATRLLQEVAKRLADWDLAPLSTRVSITPAADTSLRRRLKISLWSWAIRASALSLSVIVS